MSSCSKSLPHSIKRVPSAGAKRLRRVTLALADGITAESVYDARRNVKKVRSLLRLVGPLVKRRPREALRACLRELAADLAPARNAGAERKVLQEIGGAVREPNVRDGLAALDALLAREEERYLAELKVQVDAWLCPLGAMRHVWSSLALAPVAARVEGRVQRMSRAARKAFVRARRDPIDIPLHAWRKKTKRLVHALTFLGARPAFVAGLKRLNRTLGAHQDCAVLDEWLQRHTTPATETAVVRLKEEVARRKHALAAEALRQGCALFG